MIQKVIKVPFRKIKWIAHLADIHIRNLKRHKEYEECFSRLYEEIKKLDGNGVIYIGGDIVHAKTQMSPELVHQTSNFFKNLSDIAPTIVIAGNHDCNLNNSSRMDTLTPIINNINSSNLHYLKDSGEYKIADTSFVVMSIFDDPKDYIKSKDINSKNKIALFHGTVAKSKTDFGFRLMSDVKIDVFRGYDMALLGDIHKHQYLNWKKNIAYCGSLICQNHGEDLIKGFLIWDVPKRSSEFIRLENDYGYYTLDVDSGKVPDVSDMPKKARLRVRVANTDASKLKKALAVIHKKYGIKEISVFRTDALSQQKSGDRLNKITIGDITNTDYQFELIEDYLKRNYIVSSDILFKIKNINDDLNAGLPEEEVSRNVSWKIKKFEFDNMFSYGEDNSVDFTKLDGITGLFAANASGKSALLDSLSFCLFDTCSRAFKANNVLNNKKKKFKCRVNFEVGEQDYFIERVAKKQRNGHVKVNVDFWMLDDAGDKISLNGDQRRTTNLNIKKIIGTFDDFVLTTLSVQNNNTVFIDKTQKERKELLAQFMGIGIFDQLYTLAHEEISDVAAVLKNFKKNDYGKDLADVEQNLLDSKEQHKELKKKKREVNKEKKLLDKSILESTKSLKPIDASVIDIETFKIKEKELTDILNTIDIKLGTIKNNKKEYKINEKGIKKRIESYVNQNINSDYLNLQQFELERNNTKIEIDKLKIDVQHKIDKIQKLGNLEYDPNCSYCMDNIFVKDAIKTKEDLNKDKKIANELVRKLDEVDENILGLKGIKEKKVDFDQLLEALKDIEIQYNKTDSEKKLLCERKKNIINQIAIIEEKIQEYYEIEKEIIFNKSVESEIEKLQNEVSNLEYQIDVIDKKMSSVHGMIKVYETKKETIIDKISQVESLEDKYTAYEYYLDSIKRDGVPYELITKALPTIESEVNDILGHIVDFSIILEMDGKNINTYIVYDQDNMWPLELASGMERFVSSLALRVGLINVSNLPRTNFLAIDEGFGNMDGDNLNSVYMLFQYLKTQFQFVLIVSHIETMRDTVDKLLEIKKENNFSQITFN